MCGVIGTVARRLMPATEALRTLAHRGPDGEGSFSSGGVWLGHRRLSIIDLSTSASQPMLRTGCGVIAFNGEIYDHAAHRVALEKEGIRFDTHSDTEVLLRGLAARGSRFLVGLHGMYAFAWLEPSGRRLWLARDHAGMKPLYLWRGQQGIAFASEVRALAVAVRALGGTVRSNASSLADFLAWGSIPEPSCILQGAEMVPVDSAVAVDVDDPTATRVVPIGRLAEQPEEVQGQPLDSVRASLGAAVRRHLVADTPIALFLSAGIDSGVLAAEVAREASPRPCAITVVLESEGTADEAAIVRALTNRLGLSLQIVSRQDWESRLDGALAAFDQPSVDGLNTFLIAGVAHEAGYKVALSGIGADEVFGGYQHFHRSLDWVGRMPGVGMAQRMLGPLETSGRPALRRAGMLLDAVAHGQPCQPAWRRILPESLVRRILPGADRKPLPIPSDDPLRQEQETYLRNTLLRDTDVMGMASGLEIRAPYLDPQVLSTARALGTATILARSRPPKWLLREAWAGELEPSTLSRQKTGFTLDVARWLRGPARPIVEEARERLGRSAAIDRGTFQKAWRIWTARLDSHHQGAWVPVFAFVQLAEQMRRWGEPA